MTVFFLSFSFAMFVINCFSVPVQFLFVTTPHFLSFQNTLNCCTGYAKLCAIAVFNGPSFLSFKLTCFSPIESHILILATTNVRQNAGLKSRADI